MILTVALRSLVSTTPVYRVEGPLETPGGAWEETPLESQGEIWEAQWEAPWEEILADLLAVRA